MNADKLTTILGGVMAAGGAAHTVIGQMQPGSSMHSQDYMALGMSVLMALFGYFTNKAKKTA